VPAARAHAADAGGRGFAAAVVAAEDQAARIADHLVFAAQPFDRRIIEPLPHLIVAARAELGAEVVVALRHGCSGAKRDRDCQPSVPNGSACPMLRGLCARKSAATGTQGSAEFNKE